MINYSAIAPKDCICPQHHAGKFSISVSVSKISRSLSLIIHYNQLYRQKNSFGTHTRDSALTSDLLRVKGNNINMPLNMAC
jgi:hypothetical protein